jgi:hypothetical protein
MYVHRVCLLSLLAVLFVSSLGIAKSVDLPQSDVRDQNAVQSYREWKSTMVGAAELRVQKIKLSLEKQQRSIGESLDPNLKYQLSREQLQATIAGELTISDYFAGYLNKQKNMQDAIALVAEKLTKDEVAELMSAYAYSFNKTVLPPLRSGSNAAQKTNPE